jgi:hypothetical protein
MQLSYSARGSLALKLEVAIFLGCLLAIVQTVRLVGLILHGDFLQERKGEQTKAGDTDHRLPDNRHALRESNADFRAQRLLEILDDRNGAVCDFGTSRELSGETSRQVSLELVLEDSSRDSETPCLR